MKEFPTIFNVMTFVVLIGSIIMTLGILLQYNELSNATEKKDALIETLCNNANNIQPCFGYLIEKD